MDKLCCPLPKDTTLRLVSSCLLTITGGGLAVYCWRRRTEAAIKRQVAKATENRKSRVRKQKDAMRAKSRSAENSLEKRIVSLSSEDLLKELSEKRLTVLQVLEAYKAKSFQIDLRTNCITEYLEDAEDQAILLDCQSEKGPLYGLPISVKETYGIKGLDCTSGVAYLLDKPRQKDATIIASLKRLGAVIFARTNIVQTTCSIGHSNPIYGATTNPYNPKRVPGGSTCGEGALIGAGGSLVGFGTDVGGSVRVPAVMSGQFCLKPTQKRLSGDGIKPSIPGIVGLHDCPGIMSRDVQGLITVFKALVTSIMFDMDPRVIPLTFQEKLFNNTEPLTIGYYEDDGIVGPTPGCRRAVRVAKRVLEKMGHKVIPFTIPNVRKAHELAMNFVGADAGQGLHEALRYEPIIDDCMAYVKKGIFHRIKEIVTRKKQFSLLSATITEKSAYDLWRLMADREDYLDLFISTMKTNQIDALLAPGTATPAFAPEFLDPTGGVIFITNMYNMLNFPVGTVPITRETEGDQKALENYPADGELQRHMKEATKGATGLPLGVQVVGLPWQEEMVLRVMKVLDEGIKNRCVPDEPTPPIMDIIG